VNKVELGVFLNQIFPRGCMSEIQLVSIFKEEWMDNIFLKYVYLQLKLDVDFHGHDTG
jgi:hypothetical protein